MSLTKAYATTVGVVASGTGLTTGTFDSTGYTHIVAFGKHEDTTTTFTFSDNKSSTGWNLLTKQTNANGDLESQMAWVKIGSPGTGHTVTLTLGAAKAFRLLTVWLVNASGGTAEQDAAAGNTGSSAAPATGTLSTTGASVVAFFGIGLYNGPGMTFSSGWTKDFDSTASSVAGAAASRGPETTSPMTPSATWAHNDAWTASALALREPSGGDVTVALTGTSGAFSAGTIAPSSSIAITGQSATFAAGSLTPSNSTALTGQRATFTPGTIAPALSIALSGNVGTFSSGSLVPALSASLTGQRATFAAGTLVPNTDVPLAGQRATFTAGTVTTGNDVTVSLTGQVATFSSGALKPNTSLALTGQRATWASGTAMPTAQLALTGIAATFSPGSLSPSISAPLSGQRAVFTLGTLGVAGDVTVVLTGSRATFFAGTMVTGGGMPNVVGMNYYMALLTLQTAGIYVPNNVLAFNVTAITVRWQKSNFAGGIVVAQSPASGTSVVANQPITLTLSTYPFGAEVDSPPDWTQRT